jgi:hypothetical protein
MNELYKKVAIAIHQEYTLCYFGDVPKIIVHNGIQIDITYSINRICNIFSISCFELGDLDIIMKNYISYLDNIPKYITLLILEINSKMASKNERMLKIKCDSLKDKNKSLLQEKKNLEIKFNKMLTTYQRLFTNNDDFTEEKIFSTI